MSFEELIKKYEPSMAVPMYPKALVIDFMEKAYEAGLHSDVHTDNSKVIAEFKTELDFMERACDGAAEMYSDLKTARELIKNIIRVTWGEGWNYSLDWKVKAEQFLNREVEK